jgi:predicted metal-dependent peptidase
MGAPAVQETEAWTVAAEARRVSALRMQLLEHHAFWGHLLLQVRLVPAPELDALAATDCVRHIWYNPHRTRVLPLKQLGFVLAHEVGHAVFASAGRARGRHPVVWNQATDYAINRVVARIPHPHRPGEALYEPPPGVLLHPRFDGWIAEAIYEQLMTEAPPVAVTARLRIEGQDMGAVVDHGGGIDLHLPRELSPEEEQTLRDQLEAAASAWRASGGPGDLPGGLARVIPRRGRSVIPWRRVLARFAAEALSPHDYSLARPNRRYLSEDLLVPGIVRRERRELIVAVDSSGSMGADELSCVGAEIAALAGQESRVTLIVADARIQQVVTPRDLPGFLERLRVRGGGGTDHRPVFEWIEAERREPPDLFIGLSDLWSRFPARAPRYPVLWVCPPAHGEAPWGQVVEMRTDRATAAPG